MAKLARPFAKTVYAKSWVRGTSCWWPAKVPSVENNASMISSGCRTTGLPKTETPLKASPSRPNARTPTETFESGIGPGRKPRVGMMTLPIRAIDARHCREDRPNAVGACVARGSGWYSTHRLPATVFSYSDWQLRLCSGCWRLLLKDRQACSMSGSTYLQMR